jgi:hypothetical protein
VWQNPPPTSSKLREDMSKLVPQGAIEFLRVGNQPRV